MANLFSLQHRTALVTGGSRGLGLAFATALASAGADVAIFDVIPPSERFDKLAKAFNVKTAHYTVDVSDMESLEEGFRAFKSDFKGKLDICVPCAGVNKNVSFLETSLADFDRLSNINIRGVYFTAKLAAAAMIENKSTHGSIILIASIASHRAIRSQNSTAYCGTKGAVLAMCPAIAAELAQYSIRVNTISPGYVRTEMTTPFPHLLEEWRDEIMNGQVANPDDLIGGCIFLASDASRYMTGQDLILDGGVTKW